MKANYWKNKTKSNNNMELNDLIPIKVVVQYVFSITWLLEGWEAGRRNQNVLICLEVKQVGSCWKFPEVILVE